MKRNARIGWDHTLRYCSVLALGLTSLGLAACENGDVGAIPSTELAPLVQEADARTQPERMELVFESRVAVSDENEIVDSDVAGELDQAERERVAGQLREARALQIAQQRELARLKAEVETAERGLEETRALLARLEDELTNL